MAIGMFLDKYLGKNNGGGGGAGGGAFVVTFTPQEDMSVTADKTFAEVTAAFEQGQNVIGVANTVIFNVVNKDDGVIDFCSVSAIVGEGAVDGINVYSITMEADGDIIVAFGAIMAEA